jgi:seryl-tRNA(Sec) selenium transferase
MNTQMVVCHKIMQILDDNAQQVPEGFYLEVCDQLKHLHVAVERYEPDERELGLNEAERMLNRKAEKLKEDREHLNECVLNYNKTATAYLEKVKKYNKAAASVKRVRAWQLAREARLDDREDNITLAQLQRQLLE